nr:apyrase-like [Danaus plexippus plexippus]
MYGIWPLFLLCVISVCGEKLFELDILHYNDFHARFVETSPSGSVCNPTAAPCIGGFARLATLIRDGLERNPESLVLNGGDSFQGTIWYNLLRWNVTQDFMNMVHHDAHVLGNHEFDNGIEGVVPYLQHLQSQVVTANIIDDDEPTIQGLYKPSIVVEKGGRKIGIIGVIISSTDELASTGNLKFTDEVEAVRREAEKLNEQGINIIVVLSHCGIDIDRKIALNAGPHIDIIVGGHSHTLLSNSDPPEGSTWTPLGPYPVVVEQTARSVLIVQAGAHTAFLGEIKLNFNDNGDLISWVGDPHYIGNNVLPAPDVLEKINEYLPVITEQATELIGIDTENNYKKISDVTFEKILLTTPFENNVEMFDLKGVYIKELLEYAVANLPYPGARMVQVSGMRIVFNGSQPLGSRVFEVFVRCIDCDIPQYYPLRLDTYYKVVSQDFIGNGGGGYTMMSNNRQNVEVLGVDYDILLRYVRHQSASTGNLKFTDEVEAVRREAEKLNEQGINIIVVLSHCGIDIDRKIALNAGPHIDIIVGGHSHTLLSNSDPPEGSTWTPLGPYPVVVEQTARSVLIVQAGAHTAFLGEIKLYFNDKGDLINWIGDPHYITNNVVQAPDVLDKINEYLPIINEQATELIGTSKIHLSSECNCGECNLGSFICDAFMHETVMRSKRNKWNEAHLCVINSGGVRSDIEPGNVTFEKILLTTPFENNVEMFDLKGVYIKELLEYAVANEPYPGARMVQVSGMRIVFNGSQPLGSRVFEVFVRCIDCDIPQYYPLRLDTYYKVVSQDFIGNGGGGYTMMSNNRQNVEVLGVDYDILLRYVRHQSPIMKDLDGRILIKDPCLEN